MIDHIFCNDFRSGSILVTFSISFTRDNSQIEEDIKKSLWTAVANGRLGEAATNPSERDKFITAGNV